MTRIEEIDALLKSLELTHNVVVSDSPKRSEVVAVIDFLRQAAFNLTQEREALRKQSEAEAKSKTIEPEIVA